MSSRLLLMKPSSLPNFEWVDKGEASYELTKAQNDVRRCQHELMVALDRLERAVEKALLKRKGEG